MGFRFFRRLKIAPGVSLNFSKSGISPSFGTRGARFTLGRQGPRTTVGIPGTGLFYTELHSGRKRRRDARGRSGRSRAKPPPPRHDLDLGFFKRLLTPKSEEAFVDGCREYVARRHRRALEHFERANGIPDADFLAGFLLLGENRPADAKERLLAAARAKTLGDLAAKYDLRIRIMLPITEEFAAIVEPTRRGALLGVAEAHQILDEPDQAIPCLRLILRDAPDDVVARVSLAELLLERRAADPRAAREIVELATGVENESEAHAALLLYKGRALRTLGMPTAARDTLTPALRKRKGRSDELLRAIRYERALAYEELGHRTRARREYEKIFAEDPRYEDVARRLGLPPVRGARSS